MSIDLNQDELQAVFARMDQLYGQSAKALDSGLLESTLPVNVVDFIVFWEHARLWAERLEECETFIQTIQDNLDVHDRNLKKIMDGRVTIGNVPKPEIEPKGG